MSASLVGSEMCIRDSITHSAAQRRKSATTPNDCFTLPQAAGAKTRDSGTGVRVLPHIATFCVCFLHLLWGPYGTGSMSEKMAMPGKSGKVMICT
eukprot:4360411-Alexandrium_andersonii.AAC.1